MFDTIPYSLDNTYNQSNDFDVRFSNDENSKESITDVISLSSALETIMSQTLMLTSQTFSRTIPQLLRECASSAVKKSLHKLQFEYERFGPRRHIRATDLGSVGGYFRPHLLFASNSAENYENDEFVITMHTSISLGKARDDYFDWMWIDGREVRFTSLPWIDRQLVYEWRTYEWDTGETSLDGDEFEESFCLDSCRNTINPSLKDNLILMKDFENICELENTALSKELETRNQGDRSISIAEDTNEPDDQFDSKEYDRARTLAPRPLPKPEWEHASSCYICQRSFGPTLHRHHCRRCGHSYCDAHSNYYHRLPHLGYDRKIPERVCRGCKIVLDSRDLEERVYWKLARCRDFLAGNLTPYFETGVDTVEDAAFRLTRVAISLARSIPLGAQAYVAIETVEILRKHGLSGVYGLLFRKEFLAAADLICRILGLNKKNFPLSLHELSAAIFYSLAQHRALRGLNPDSEEFIHSLKRIESCSSCDDNEKWLLQRPTVSSANFSHSLHMVEDEDAGDTIVFEGSFRTRNDCIESVLDETDIYDHKPGNSVDLLHFPALKHTCVSNQTKEWSPNMRKSYGVDVEDTLSHQFHQSPQAEISFEPVCEFVSDTIISTLLFYAPLALNFIYAECEVDMQLLAAQQGWRLVYASLDQNNYHSDKKGECSPEGDDIPTDKPASALFAHQEKKIACLSVRGTTTIQDVVTDIRAMPVPFPQQDEEENNECTTDDAFCDHEEWTPVFRGKGFALCGMAGAALNLFRENADSLIFLARHGYKIRIVGHSLGGSVAALLGMLISHYLEKNKVMTSSVPHSLSIDDDRLLRVYAYGSPSCVDGKLADYTRAYVTNVVLHDDIVPRLTPTSMRSLLKHLLHIKETWVKAHLSDDLKCFHERAYNVWPERLRGSFTLLKKKGINSAKRLKNSYKKQVQVQTRDSEGKRRHNGRHNGRHETSFVATENSDVNVGRNDQTCYVKDLDSICAEEGLEIEGDLFFDPMYDDPMNESDDESLSELARRPDEMIELPSLLPSNKCENNWAPFDEPPIKETSFYPVRVSNHEQPQPTLNSDKKLDDKTQSPVPPDSPPLLLEELPLPRLFIPGKIVHIYTYRGGYKAAFVPRKFKALRRINTAGNCLSDHMCKAYYESLLEVKAVRSAKHDLPQWVGFSQDSTCACCASVFTWASTSDTLAQAARDKHNCRSCGGLVCDPCSRNRVPIPLIGIISPVRVCDRCYNGWGLMHGEFGHFNHSYVGINEDSKYNHFESTPSKSSRRSHVVDELASRLPTVK